MVAIRSPLSDFLALWSSHCQVKHRPHGADSADPHCHFLLLSVARGSGRARTSIMGQQAPIAHLILGSPYMFSPSSTTNMFPICRHARRSNITRECPPPRLISQGNALLPFQCYKGNALPPSNEPVSHLPSRAAHRQLQRASPVCAGTDCTRLCKM